MISNQWVKFCTAVFMKVPSLKANTCAVIALLILCLQPAHANDSEKVKVTIDINQPEHHLAQITIAHPKTSSQELLFRFPNWRTGKYKILDLANGIRDFTAKTADGETLPWQKIDKSTWQVSANQQAVTISYQLYANQLGGRTRHIDDSHAFIDATSAIFYTKESRPLTHVVDLKVPVEWRSVSGMPTGETKHQFIASDYDILADSPIETGINRLYKFREGGQDYEIVIWGKGNYDTEHIVDDFKKLVQQPEKIWGDEYPFERYVFMIHATTGVRGATEHLNSTIIQRSRFSFNHPSDYLSFLSTSAHELVHTWNVKAYRPKGMVPYNYQSENYTSLLWLVEGSTSYLQDKLLTYSELMNSLEFMAKLATNITSYIDKPGRQVQSVAEASFDAWIDEAGDRGNNASVDIYAEGYLISWLLDFELLFESGGDIGYTDVHRELYKRHRIPDGYTEADVLAILKDLTGDDYTNWWQEHVHGTPVVDFEKLIRRVGLEMYYGGSKPKAWFGAEVNVKNGFAKLSSVEKDGPAWQAGLTNDDIIVAIEGLRFIADDIDDRIHNFKPEQEIEVTIFRRDQLMTKTVKLGKKHKGKLQLRVVERPTRKQKRMFKAWTGLSLPVNSYR